MAIHEFDMHTMETQSIEEKVMPNRLSRHRLGWILRRPPCKKSGRSVRSGSCWSLRCKTENTWPYMRYRGRVDTMLNALNSDQDLFVAELSLAQARPDELLSWSRSTEFSVEGGSNKIWGIWPQWYDPPVSAEISAFCRWLGMLLRHDPS